MWVSPFEPSKRKNAADKLDGAFYSLAVQFLKRVAPDVSLAVAGYHMVRRSVSLLCVDPVTDTTLSAITAMLFYSPNTANASDLLQAFCRFCGTGAVSRFHKAFEEAGGSTGVEVMAPQHVLGVVNAVKNFSSKFCGPPEHPKTRAETLAFLADLDCPIREGEHPDKVINSFVGAAATQRGEDAAAGTDAPQAALATSMRL